MDVSWVDWALIGIIALSTIISLIRGFTREVFSLLTWIVAVIVAIQFTPALSAWLEPHINMVELRLLAAFVGLFITTIILGSLINFGVAQLVNGSGLSGTDRMLGSLFGITRGLFISVLLIIAAGLTPLVNSPVWKEARLIPVFAPLSQWMLSFVPQEATVAWLKELDTSKKQPSETTPPDDIGVLD